MITAYDRKKYTWKLLYSHMMGYDVDFGHKQAADLIPSNNYDEKQVGYQALTILLNEVCCSTAQKRRDRVPALDPRPLACSIHIMLACHAGPILMPKHGAGG